MQIVICHLTRMEYPYICVAGIDLETMKYVRLVPPRRQRIHIRFLTTFGGPFAVGACIDPGPTNPIGVPPEIEDSEFLPHLAQTTRQLSPVDFWSLLSKVAVSDFQNAFGKPLKRTGRSFSAPAGFCTTSLSCMKASKDVILFVEDHLNGKRVRLARTGKKDEASIPVTDLRLYKQVLNFPVDGQRVHSLNSQLKKGTRALLALGLTRPYS